MVTVDRTRLRAELQTFPPYIPGRAPQEVPGLTPYRLSSNENHLDPLPAVLESLAQPGELPSRYPDDAAVALRARIGEVFGVPPERTIVTAGASELLVALTQITSDNRTEAVYPWPSFEMYPQLSSFSGATQIAVPLTADGRHDLPAMAQAITDATGLVLLCSPNNPTGAVLGQAEFASFMSQVPEDIIVVLDEAYIEFADGSEAVGALRTADGHPDAPVDMGQALDTYSNLAVLRTFSKAHGLAGLRVGYTVAHPTIIHEMRKSIAPFSVGAAGQAAGLVSLALRDEVHVRAKAVGATRDDLAVRLRELGIDVPPSGGNFVWLPFSEHDAHAFAEACLARGLAVRDLGRGIRVTVGPDEAMDRLVDIAARFMEDRRA